jgi:hypothetical protein
VAFALAMLGCLFGCLIWAVSVRAPVAAWALVAVSALWLPANNRQLEGSTLLVLSSTHAVTQADALGAICWLIGTGILAWHAVSAPGRRPWTSIIAMFAGCCVVFGLGALVAFENG